jgi:D-serine deaminase-like pyridoxal phosphate-dependent protein
MGYLNSFPDLNFKVAAFLLTRVISKPADNLLCFDLGHKSVASENPLQNRVFFPDVKEYTVISQSEEHLVIKTPSSHKYKIGDSVIGWPQHICPTVALHRQANLIIENKISVENWQVSSRDRI